MLHHEPWSCHPEPLPTHAPPAQGEFGVVLVNKPRGAEVQLLLQAIHADRVGGLAGGRQSAGATPPG